MTRQVERIIVEGMDGAGKTILIEQLAKEFPQLFVVRNDKEDKQDFERWWPEQLELEATEHPPIHDRFFYSELVYGPVIRGRLSVSSTLIQNIQWFLRAGSLLIYARPHSNELRQALYTKEQMEGVVSKFNELLEHYDHLMEIEKSWFGNRFFHYVWHREGELERVKELVRGYLTGEVR